MANDAIINCISETVLSFVLFVENTNENLNLFPYVILNWMSDDKNSLILCPIFAASMPFVLTVTLILNHRIEVHFSNFSEILRFEWHRQCRIPVNHLDIIELHTHTKWPVTASKLPRTSVNHNRIIRFLLLVIAPAINGHNEAAIISNQSKFDVPIHCETILIEWFILRQRSKYLEMTIHQFCICFKAIANIWKCNSSSCNSFSRIFPIS